MSGRERPLDVHDGPLAAFANDLRLLRQTAGAPSYRALARRAGYSASVLWTAARGLELPSLPVLLAYVGACDGDQGSWERRWRELERTLNTDRAPFAPATGTPQELPLDVYTFTGRRRELTELDVLLAEAGDTARVAVISGTAGVGKTALAVHWAHGVVDRFPDGILYVNLRGYSPDQPLDPGEALAAFLRTLGVAGQEIPHEPSERAARFRSLLAGRRMLVLLDNAHSAEQVRPLLPGRSATFVLVTSRDNLGGLVIRQGAGRVSLTVPPRDEAITLLRAIVGPRVDAEPDAAVALVERCARLPLALRILGETALSRPTATLAEFAAELDDERGRLDRFDADPDEEARVRAVFSWSCQRLPAAAYGMFRRLGLHPGRDFGTGAAAALAGIVREDAVRLVEVLQRVHLIEPSADGRGRMHDLLRAYAAERAGDEPEADQRLARTRLLDYYAATAESADAVLFAANRPADSAPALGARFPNAAAAKHWLDVERVNLVATTVYAATDGWPEHAHRLGLSLSRYLRVNCHYADAAVVHEHSLSVARAAGDRAVEAAHLHDLAMLAYRQGRYEEAVAHYERGLEIFWAIGDRTGAARTLGNIGCVYLVRGWHDRAVEYHQQALEMFREIGDLAGEATGLHNIGLVYRTQGRQGRAAEHYAQSLARFRELGERARESRTLCSLGYVQVRLGRCAEALDNLQDALRMARELGARDIEADTLDNIGLARQKLGDPAGAVPEHLAALAIQRELGAADECESLANLAAAYRRLGRLDEALDHARTARALARRYGRDWEEITALSGIAETLLAMGQPEDARTHFLGALERAQRIDARHEQAGALDGAARALCALGHPDEARRYWVEALRIYTELEVPEAEEVRARLH
jgi:tetratricopeptide (TPR) repeat protein